MMNYMAGTVYILFGGNGTTYQRGSTKAQGPFASLDIAYCLLQL